MSLSSSCIAPEQVTDRDFLDFDRPVRPEFTMHLASCSFCRQECQAYKLYDLRLRERLAFKTAPARQSCPAPQRLGEYSIGLLPQPERQTVTAHLLGCAWCQQENESLLAWLAPDVPALNVSAVSHLRRVAASLLSGPKSGNYGLAGVRGSSDGWPAVYQAEDITVTLTFQPAANLRSEYMLIGMVQSMSNPPVSLEGVKLTFLRQGTAFAVEQVDDLGNFLFEGLAAALPFELELSLADKVVELNDLHPE